MFVEGFVVLGQLRHLLDEVVDLGQGRVLILSESRVALADMNRLFTGQFRISFVNSRTVQTFCTINLYQPLTDTHIYTYIHTYIH